MFKKTLTAFIFFGLFSSCNLKKAEQGSPQGILSEYVTLGFSVSSVEDKKKMMEFTTDEVKTTLEKLSDAEFKNRFIDQKKKFGSLKIKDERALGENQHSITYELTYVSEHAADSKDVVTIKKHAVFTKVAGVWKISEVKNLKTFIEHQNELSF